MKNKKITLKEFFNSDRSLAIHCDTEEKANILLKAFDKMGKKWNSSTLYTKESNYEWYKEETCYYNDGTYCKKDWCLTMGAKVYEFEEVKLGNRTMNDNVKKVFEILGVEPNEVFKIKDDKNKEPRYRYFFDDNLTLKFLNDTCEEWLFASAKTFMELIKGTYTIIKLPKKKKLRDITVEEYTTWKTKNCSKCNNCIFKNVNCNENSVGYWINNKDLYSDKFLDQEVEVPE